MRILIVSHSSVVDVYQDKLRYLAGIRDFHVTLLVPERYFEGGRLVEAHRGSGEYNVVTKSARFTDSAVQNGWHFKRLGRLLTKLDPDIIHLEEEPESIVTFQVIRKALKLRRKPKIVLFSWRNMKFPYEHWSAVHLKGLVLDLVQRMNIPHIDHLLAGTHETEAHFRALGYGGPVTILPQYGVNTAIYRPEATSQNIRESLGIEKDSTIVGFVGRVMKMKGLDTLVRAVKRLQGQSIHVVIVGNGDYMNEMQHSINNLNLHHCFHFMNNVPASDVPSIMRSFDMLCIPSLTSSHWKEQFGRVIVEAMACGIPVIGSTSGEIPYVIGDAGRIFREGDDMQLAEIILELASSKDYRNELRQRGLSRVRSEYDNERIAQGIADVYTSLVAKDLQ